MSGVVAKARLTKPLPSKSPLNDHTLLPKTTTSVTTPSLKHPLSTLRTAFQPFLQVQATVLGPLRAREASTAGRRVAFYRKTSRNSRFEISVSTEGLGFGSSGLHSVTLCRRQVRKRVEVNLRDSWNSVHSFNRLACHFIESPITIKSSSVVESFETLRLEPIAFAVTSWRHYSQHGR